MKTRMQDTSLSAYVAIQPRLPKKQKEVYRLLREASQQGMDMTNYELARALHWQINCVTGRVNELVKMGLVQKAGRRWNKETQAWNIAWRTRK